MCRRTLLGVYLCVGLLFLRGVLPVDAQGPESNRYCLTGGHGLAGYDPVGYFPQGGGRPQKGLSKLSLVFDGVPYRFASQVNLDLFKKAPTRYLPQYGGWCSYGVAVSVGMVSNPETFEIRDGKLYLFGGTRMREMWLMNSRSLVQEADANWSLLFKS
jgi:YHS domain-containing protein